MSSSTEPYAASDTRFDLAIRGGTIHTAHDSYAADVYATGDRIAAIVAPGSGYPAQTEVNATGLDVLPGLWHCHCHFRDPGYSDKEDFETGTRAAALGGITFCIEQPNTKPIPVTREAFQEKVAIAAAKAFVDFGINGGGLLPENIEDLADAGAISIKIFNTRHVRDSYPYIPELNVVEHDHLFQIFEAAADAGILVSIHPDDADWARAIVDRKYIQKGRTSRADYEDAVTSGHMYGHGMVVGFMTAAYYADLAGTRLYTLHHGLMPLESLDAIRFAKHDRQTPLYAELELSAATLTPEHARRVGPKVFHVGREPKSEIWRSARDGTVDTLVLEHAPHTEADIASGWSDHFNIPLGETGVQEMVPMILTAVNEGHITLKDVVRLCSETPAKIFGLHPRKGTIEVGADADFTVVDMHAPGEYRDEDAASKVGYTSWQGMPYMGRPEYTVVRGTIVMSRGTIVGEKGYGKMGRPSR